MNEDRYRVGFWLGVGSVGSFIVTTFITLALDDTDIPSIIKKLFVFALLWWLYFAYRATKEGVIGRNRPIEAGDYLVCLLLCIFMQALLPIWIVGSPYWIWKYRKLKNYS